MGNSGTFTVGLLNAEGDPAVEPAGTVDFVELDGTSILRAHNLQFPPSHSFTLPAFPQARNLHCVITPSLYRAVQSEFFTLTAGKPIDESAVVLRDPDHWRPQFTPWNALAAPFTALKAVLDGKFVKLKHGPDVGVVTPGVYDGMASSALLLAKMALLNLFTVLSSQNDPVSDQPWFNAVKQILMIDRERFVATVTGNLYESIDHILSHMDTFRSQGFFPADSSLHYDNIPGDYQPTAPIISVKRVYEEGNVQFTMAKVRNAAGAAAILLDCDMDEHSNVIEHLSDLFTHVFTGGTHPIDIHEYIVNRQTGADLGYRLRPAGEALAAGAA